jgi:hypothetical protein
VGLNLRLLVAGRRQPHPLFIGLVALAALHCSSGTSRTVGATGGGTEGPDGTGGAISPGGAGGGGATGGGTPQAGAGGAGGTGGTSGGTGGGAADTATGTGGMGGTTGGAKGGTTGTTRDAATGPEAGAPDGAPAAGGTGGGMGGAGGCPGDLSQGWTQYMDDFDVQHPYDLQVSDRFKFDNGIYTTWIFPNDKPHAMNNTTAPRTEMRWHTNFTTGQWMWSGDVMYESPTTHTCIMQIKSETAHEAIYLNVANGDLKNSTGPAFLKGHYGKWFHLTVTFNADTLEVKVYVNNCLMLTSQSNQTGPFYFKNGTYGCQATMCRANFKNITLWKK